MTTPTPRRPRGRPRTKAAPDAVIALRVPAAEADALRARAREAERTIAAEIRLAIRAWLARE